MRRLLIALAILALIAGALYYLIAMPGMDGIEVCRQIRAAHNQQGPRIIMYTADERDSTKDKSLEAGADALLTKETPIYDLPGKIRSYLSATV